MVWFTLVYKGLGYSFSSLQFQFFCLDFKWLGFRISDPLWNLNLLQTRSFEPLSFWPFKIWTCWDFRSLLYSEVHFLDPYTVCKRLIRNLPRHPKLKVWRKPEVFKHDKDSASGNVWLISYRNGNYRKI